MGTSSETLVRDKLHLLANNTAQNKGLVDEQDKMSGWKGFRKCMVRFVGFASWGSLVGRV